MERNIGAPDFIAIERRMRQKYQYKMLTDEQFEALIKQGLVCKPAETPPKHAKPTKTADTSHPAKIASGEPDL
ncbi:MAG: hypothetical protein JSV99_07900 [Planctomycetota bacterium]|nr:MAG: hypothetical protein JSV99_07900 [Planctomycetota bacterium]